MWAGEHPVQIEGYGTVDITIKGPAGPRIITLTDVAYCPTFACNIVSLRELNKRGIWWDNSPGNSCLRRPDRTVLGDLSDHCGQYVVEFIPQKIPQAAFLTRRRILNSWTARATSTADAMTWHLRLGHPGP